MLGSFRAGKAPAMKDREGYLGFIPECFWSLPGDGRGWDLVGDIHGQMGKLETLLGRMGYGKKRGVWTHSERRILFLGDLIDRGPDIRGVLLAARAMVESGGAAVIMGNHELNAIHYHTLGRDGKPLRPHSRRKTLQHRATLDQFLGRDGELAEWIDWFRSLPVAVETEEFRAVHACWSSTYLDAIRTRSFRDPEFVQDTADPACDSGRAIEVLLKGPEIRFPQGIRFSDKDGHERDAMRVRWWNTESCMSTFSELVMPPGSEAPDGAPREEDLVSIPCYPKGDKTVFFGHYWLSPEFPVSPLGENVMCLDYGAGKDGPLVACRWMGSLEQSEFFSTKP